MGIREQNLETVAPIFATFGIHQTDSIDDLKDDDIGCGVMLTSGNEIGPCTGNCKVLGKLIALSLSDSDDGRRVATVQIGGIMTLPITTTFPEIGDSIVGGTAGTVKQAPALASYDPAGGTLARGIVLEVSGDDYCTVYLA